MVRFGMAMAVLACMAAPLFAQESTEQLKKELEQLRAEVDGLKAVNQTKEIPASGKVQADAMAADDNPVMTLFKQTKLSGFVDAGYVVSFNHLSVFGSANNQAPGSVGNNPVRLFDDRANSFYLNAVQLNLERLATKDMIVGYHLELAAGHDPAIYDAGNVALQEGWVQIMAPLGSGLDIRVGKMAKLAGYEVIESVNDLNYSRGMLFSFLQPFTTTGVRASYNMNEMFSATIGFNNGFNRGGNTFEDGDHGKDFEAQFEIKPVKDLLIATTIMIGNDTAVISNSTNDKHYLWDIVVAYTMDKLTVAMNFDWESAQGVLGARRAAQSGLAIYGRYQVTDAFAGALRVEYMSDHDGLFLGGTGLPGDSGTGSRVFEFTATAEFKVAQQLILRVEIRHDDSNNHDFNRDGRAARGDNTLGFEAIMPF